MYYLDYKWDLYPDKIILDNEIDTSELEWEHNDMFQLKNIDGKIMLIKIDPVVAFASGYKTNGSN